MAEDGVRLTAGERAALADEVLGGASPSPLMTRAVERIIEARLQEIAALLPGECWVTRTADIRCTDFIGGKIGNGEFIAAMCCLPCQLRAALVAEPRDAGGAS